MRIIRVPDDGVSLLGLRDRVKFIQDSCLDKLSGFSSKSLEDAGLPGLEREYSTRLYNSYNEYRINAIRKIIDSISKCLKGKAPYLVYSLVNPVTSTCAGIEVSVSPNEKLFKKVKVGTTLEEANNRILTYIREADSNKLSKRYAKYLTHLCSTNSLPFRISWVVSDSSIITSLNEVGDCLTVTYSSRFTIIIGYWSGVTSPHFTEDRSTSLVPAHLVWNLYNSFLYVPSIIKVLKTMYRYGSFREGAYVI